MKHGSLFSGIGGFDLAAEWMGWENIFHCEWNEFGQRVLKHYWPQSISYDDIKATDFNIHRGRIDILSGGFPCQPYSISGKRLGKEDDRHLWPEMLRAIREIQPRWIVGENVLGLLNWNEGLVFDEIHADLEAEGYWVQAYVLPAVSVDAPHRRDRVWFVAHSMRQRHSASTGKKDHREKRKVHQEEQGVGRRVRPEARGHSGTSTNSKGRDDLRNISEGRGNRLTRGRQTNDWENFPTQSPVCSGDDGLSYGLDDITFPKWRRESIKAYGNAVVPQVPYQIFKAIEQYEKAH